MRRFLTAACALAFMIGLAGAADAKPPCRDAKGKFVKCSTTVHAPVKRCRDAKGHFIKCKV